jgi:hypothetical protein
MLRTLTIVLTLALGALACATKDPQVASAEVKDPLPTKLARYCTPYRMTGSYIPRCHSVGTQIADPEQLEDMVRDSAGVNTRRR